MAIYNILSSTNSTAQISPWKYSMDLSTYPTIISDTLMSSVNSDGTITYFIGTNFSNISGTFTGDIYGMELRDAITNELLEEITNLIIPSSGLIDIIDATTFIQTETQNMETALGQAWQDLQYLSSGDLPILSPTMIVITLNDGTQTRYHGTGLTFDTMGNPVSGTLTGVDHFDPSTNQIINSYTFTTPFDITLTLTQINMNNFSFWDSLFSGSDIINGDEESNWLEGGNGADVIIGGEGNDMIIGGEGNDELTGGPGHDQFLFQIGGNHDIITDFTPGEDIIQLENIFGESINSYNVQVSEINGNVVLTYNSDSITLEGISLTNYPINNSGSNGSNMMGLNIDIFATAGGRLDWWEVIKTSPTSLEVANIIASATDAQITIPNIDGTLTIINGTGLTLLTGAPLSITSIQHYDSTGAILLGEVTGAIPPSFFPAPGSMALSAGLAAAMDWAQALDLTTAPLLLTDTVIIRQNIDTGTGLGLTTTVVTGTGFLGDPASAIVTGIERIASDGVTPVNNISGISIPLELIDTVLAITDMQSLISLILSGNDSYTSADPDDISISTQGGDDEIYSGSGDDTLNGGAGDDIIAGGEGDDALEGGAGEDILYGGTGSDTISGGENADTIYGGDNDDTLYGANGIDKLYGGNGNDTLYGGNDNDRLLGNDGTDKLYGGSGEDELFGGNDDDLLLGNDGMDELYGGSGNDTLYGGNDDDRLLGNDGIDKLYGGSGNDTLYGGNDDDRLLGNDGIDKLYGGSGNDTLYGGNDDDRLLGNDGIDKLYGGNGNDTLYGGNDDDRLLGNDGMDELYGGNGNDTIYGGNDDDNLLGGGGRDFLHGGSGNDNLLGGSGQDELVGGGGNDYLFGGNGSDDLYGNGGSDIFAFSNDWGNDTIYDFADGSDLIDFAASTNVNAYTDLNISYVSGNAIIDDGVGNTITVIGVAPGSLTEVDFNFI